MKSTAFGLSLLLLLCLVTVEVCAAASNRTIDDAQGDSVTGAQPVYSPEGFWHSGIGCTTCTSGIDAAGAFDNSWHETTATRGESPSVTLTFNGTAIWVYVIVATRDINEVSLFSNLSFQLDSSPIVTNDLTVDTIDDKILYNTLAYTVQGLEDTQHSLVVAPDVGPFINSSFLAFDYAIYTSDDTSTNSSTSSSSPSSSAAPDSARIHSSSSSTNTPAIVGGAIGAVFGLLAAFLSVFCFRRYRHTGPLGLDNSAPDTEKHIYPFPGPHTSEMPALQSPRSFVELTPAPDTAGSVMLSPVASSFGEISEPPDSMSGRTYRGPRTESLLSAPERAYSPDVSVTSSLPVRNTVLGLASGNTVLGNANSTFDSARMEKAALHQAELARQVREVGQAPVGLRPGSSMHAFVEGDGAEDALKRQVEALQVEMERMKAQQGLVEGLHVEAPPAYDHASSSSEIRKE